MNPSWDPEHNSADVYCCDRKIFDQDPWSTSVCLLCLIPLPIKLVSRIKICTARKTHGFCTKSRLNLCPEPTAVNKLFLSWDATLKWLYLYRTPRFDCNQVKQRNLDPHPTDFAQHFEAKRVCDEILWSCSSWIVHHETSHFLTREVNLEQVFRESSWFHFWFCAVCLRPETSLRGSKIRREISKEKRRSEHGSKTTHSQALLNVKF